MHHPERILRRLTGRHVSPHSTSFGLHAQRTYSPRVLDSSEDRIVAFVNEAKAGALLGQRVDLRNLAADATCGVEQRFARSSCQPSAGSRHGPLSSTRAQISRIH